MKNVLLFRADMGFVFLAVFAWLASKGKLNADTIENGQHVNYLVYFPNSKVVRCALVHNPPYDYVSRGSNGTLHWEGGSKYITAWQATKLKYSVELFYPTPEQIKSQGNEATMNMVARGDADFTASGYILTAPRLNIISPTTFFTWEEGYKMLVPQPGEKDRLFAFIKPFDANVWILLAVSFVLTAYLMSFLSWAFTSLVRKFTSVSNEKTKQLGPNGNEGVGTYLLYNINMLTNHDDRWIEVGDYLRMSNASFLICASLWILGASILVYGYSCIVVSSITIPGMKPVVNSFEDLVTNKDVSVVIRSDLVLGQLILNSDSSVFKALREKPGTSIINDAERLNKLLLTGKYAYPFLDTFARFFVGNQYKSEGKCRFTVSNALTLSNNYFYQLFTKENRDLKQEFSHESIKLWENGLARKWVWGSLPQADPCFVKNTQNRRVKATSIKLLDLMSAFFVLGVGLGLSLVCFLLELAAHKLSRNKRIIKKERRHPHSLK